MWKIHFSPFSSKLGMERCVSQGASPQLPRDFLPSSRRGSHGCSSCVCTERTGERVGQGVVFVYLLCVCVSGTGIELAHSTSIDGGPTLCLARCFLIQWRSKQPQTSSPRPWRERGSQTVNNRQITVVGRRVRKEPSWKGGRRWPTGGSEVGSDG